MKRKEIIVGGLYLAKVSNRIVTVRVDSVGKDYKGRTIYAVTNLSTGRHTTFASAAKFRGEARREKPGTTLGQLRARQKAEAEQCSDPTISPATPDTTTLGSETPESATVGSASEPVVATSTSPASQQVRSEDSSKQCPHCYGTGEVDDSDEPCPSCGGEGTVKMEGEQSPLFDAMSPVATTQSVPIASAMGSSLPASLSAKLSGIRAAELTSKLESNGKVAGYTPTDEQWAILEVARQPGLKVLVVGAGAGCTKTSMLTMLEAVLPGRGQYTAFNAPLVAESKRRFKKASVNTYHSLAFRAVGRLYAHRLGGPRVRSDQVAKMLGVEHLNIPTGELNFDGTPKVKTLQAGFLAGQLMVAVKKFCQSADAEISERHFQYIDGIDQPTVEGGRSYVNNQKVREYLLPFAQKAWADCSSPQGQLPLNGGLNGHDVYVKVWSLGTGVNKPVISADYIMVDESQDLSPNIIEVLKQQSHALLVMVGDDCQQIYEWRGATNAMKSFPDAPRKLLSMSFRFGQVIADVANSILATLQEPTDLVMKGLPSIPSRVGVVTSPKCVLCRTNAAAIFTILAAQADSKRAHLIGGGAEVVAFVKAAKDLQVPCPTSHPELCCFESWKEVQAYAKTDEGEDLKLLVKLVDEFGADEIIKALEHMPDEKHADFVVSTVHKVKGKEYDTVKLASDFPTIDRMGDSDRRLLYVAATRAKLVLDISECPPFCGGKCKDANGQGLCEPIPGLEIRYTVPMPTQEQVEEYQKAKREEKKETPGPCSPQADNALPLKLVPASQPSLPNGGKFERAEFSWTKNDEQWVVRGPADKTGQTVKVVRRNGSSSRETLREAVKKFPESWLYRVS